MLKNEISRAFQSYFRRCRREGFLPMQPSARNSGVERRKDGSYVVLRNSLSVLATYRISKTTGRLIFVAA